jgi:peptidoglycan hydrolase-like protein with peptidoglycan-binding domain
MTERQLNVAIGAGIRHFPEYLDKVREVCLSLGLATSRNSIVTDESKAILLSRGLINNADIYLGVFLWSTDLIPEVPNPDRTSLAEVEYDLAIKRGIPRLIFYGVNPQLPDSLESTPPRLMRFRKNLETENAVGYFTSSRDLGERVRVSLSVLLKNRFSNKSAQQNPTNQNEKPKKPRPARKKAENEGVRTEPVATVLKRGASGPEVTNWQEFLVSQNYEVEADGVFGTGTYNATRDFQLKHRIAADGIVGAATLAKAQELRTTVSAQDNKPAAAQQIVEAPLPEAETVSDVADAPPGDSVYNDETSAEAGEMRQIQAEMEEERGDTESADDPSAGERAAEEQYQESLDEQQQNGGPVEAKGASSAKTRRKRTQTEAGGVSKVLAEVARKFLLAASAAVSNATSDQSVLTIDDDKLGFKVYAIALRDFIASKDTSTPLTISIEARWGQGKSSLMRMVQNELNPRRKRLVRLTNWLKLQWWRLRWLAAAPIGYLGAVIVGLAVKNKWKGRIFADMAEGLLYSEPKTLPEAGTAAQQTEMPKIKRLLAWSVRSGLQIEAQHPTVWFNAWKYDKEEEIWSALATSILEQIKRSRWWPARVWLWMSLLWVRTNKVKAMRDLVQKIFWPVIFGGLVLLWTTYRDTIFSNISSYLSQSQITFITGVLGTGLFVSLGVKFASILEDPFSLSFEKYVKSPDYKQKIGFIGEFEADFKRIVNIVTRPVWGWKSRKLIIFIDDLDRCEPPKSADVIEAINVFLDSVGCVFVLGMDSRAVIASIETKYDKMFQRLQQDGPTNPTLGRDFLEKIIQVPFAIPPISDKSMEPYLIDIIGTKPLVQNAKSPQPRDEIPVTEPNPFTGFTPAQAADMPVVSPAGEAAKEDLGSYGDLEIWEAIEAGVKYLEPNPRQMKRFINLFRLQVYISRNRELFYESETAGGTLARKGYTPGRLAAWTAFSMRWPLIVGYLAEETQQEGLRNWLLHISTLVGHSGGWGTSKTSKASLNKSFNALSDGRFLFSAPETNGGGTARKGKAAKEPAPPVNNARSGRTWRDLPWEHYLSEPDFLRVVKALESWWTPPENKEEIQKQRDCLAMAMMFE